MCHYMSVQHQEGNSLLFYSQWISIPINSDNLFSLGYLLSQDSLVSPGSPIPVVALISPISLT